MADARPKRRWGSQLLYYFFGAALCLGATLSAPKGYSWYGSLTVFCAGLMILYGPARRRRIWRTGVRRSGEEIVCRYLPLHEGYTCIGGIAIPAIGVAALGEGFAEHQLPFMIVGSVLLLAGGLAVYSSVRMWRRCLLCITPSVLRVRGARIGTGPPLTEIRREHVQAIQPTRAPRWNWLQVEVVYRVAGVGDTTKTVTLGLQAPVVVSVQAENLLNALTVWRDGADDDPGELLDRIEGILRDRASVAA